MTLGELSTRLQTLCHDGYSLHEVKFYYNGEIKEPKELELIFNSEVTKDGFISVKLDG